MKLPMMTALAFPVASTTAENYVRTAIHQPLGANIGSSSCTYRGIDDGEGCGADAFCQIEAGKCMLRIAEQPGICHDLPEICAANWDPVCGCDGWTYSNECRAHGFGVNVQHEGCCPGDCEGSEPSDDFGPSSCTYRGVDDSEGCGADEYCEIEAGRCALQIAEQPGFCYERPDMCTADWNPVCGCDGVTYGNECSAHGAGANVQHEGCCSGDCEEPEPDPETTPCTYRGDGDDNDEGCGADAFCEIDAGKCMLNIAQQEGACYKFTGLCTMEFNPVCGCDGLSYGNPCGARESGVNVQYVGCCIGDTNMMCEGVDMV